eukprot:CAMPEP_0197855720 /NCGR_PEP_ID=MMETSP1438-20131217/27135_1 /TAXON_ID=1461541 /ORGANISM="Pterosperma sp., Strain CCMP1384" /LENGTH=108 /DNA_ID=CAMNT_0043470927 /DNA_START=275 /DNA_END=601 /DNA_ORIENTATION=+
MSHAGNNFSGAPKLVSKQQPSCEPQKRESRSLSAEDRKAANLERDAARQAEAQAHKEIRALNMEQGLKPSRRAKKEARQAAKKAAKQAEGLPYNPEEDSSEDEDVDEP